MLQVPAAAQKLLFSATMTRSIEDMKSVVMTDCFVHAPEGVRKGGEDDDEEGDDDKDDGCGRISCSGPAPDPNAWSSYALWGNSSL